MCFLRKERVSITCLHMFIPSHSASDECASSPCQRGAECIDGDNKYICDCPVGYEGTNCEIGTFLLFREKTCFDLLGNFCENATAIV